MSIIDIVLFIAYSISFICALLLIAALFLYFRKRFQVRVVSLFMLAVFFFLGAYTVNMAVAFWIRFSTSGSDAVLSSLQSEAWAIAQTCTTVGLVILTLLMYTKCQDLFLVLSGIRKGRDPHADSDSGFK
ncbi:hypothetical protein MKZ24_08380 [Paenibacillus sp. FSL R7-0297]|uniref:hypothetical protein n=1 Tax=unclassified Paenibacillus TaxID=185978 RepID=UPI0004F66DC1|nr:hypothetical protein [Paenibacillus sp. FSL R5-0912]AIQ43827.1 hypothetical protein R50912_30380 [Paenibacillus sp. FSL R5-0912]